MKIDRQALIFAVIVLAIIAIVAGLLWFASLFESSGEGAQSPSESFFSSLFPFGTTPRPTPEQEQDGDPENDGPTPALRQVTAKPTSGFTFREGRVLRYIERETGHVFDTPYDSFKTTRVSNTTIPGAFSIVWLANNSFVMQYAGVGGEVRNFLATLASSTPDQSLTGRFLDEAEEIHASAKEGEILRVQKTGRGTLIDRVNIESGASETIFSSSLRSWRTVSTDNALYVLTAASSVDGFLYKVGPEQELERVLGSTRGLSALPHPEGRYIAYSSGNNLAVFDTEESRSYPTQVDAIADKCAWFRGTTPLLFCGVSAGVTLTSPEGWYMGVQNFSDRAWVINPMRGTATLVSNLDLDAGRTIDMWRPSVSPDGSYAAFMDKGDLSLWLLKLP